MQSGGREPEDRATGRCAVGRRVDALGRVVLPAEMRKELGLREGDPIETRLEPGRVVIVKVEQECALCGRADDLIEMHEKSICTTCVSALVEVTTRRAADTGGGRGENRSWHAVASRLR